MCRSKVLVFEVDGVCSIEFVISKMTDLNRSENYPVPDETIPIIKRIKKGKNGGIKIFWSSEGIQWKGWCRRRNLNSQIYTVYCHRHGKQDSVGIKLCILSSIEIIRFLSFLFEILRHFLTHLKVMQFYVSM